MARLRTVKPRLGRQPARVLAPAKVAEPFYQSAAWARLKARRRLDKDYFAALARAKSGERLILDHVRERKDGGADLDPANTEWLTFTEHQAKTAKVKAWRARGGG